MTSTEQPSARADDGGPTDADALWRLHGPGALRYATVLVGPDDAHDIVANAFLRVTRSAGWTSVANQRAYLLRAVTNQAHDHRRQRARQWRRDLAAVGPSTEPERELHIDLRRHIAALSVQQRAVVFFVYWEDMTEPAIAEMLRLSTGTVHRNLTRAKARLRKALE